MKIMAFLSLHTTQFAYAIFQCNTESSVNESCFFNEQCEAFNFQTECRDGKCICRFEMSPIVNKDGTIECKGNFLSCTLLVFVVFYCFTISTPSIGVYVCPICETSWPKMIQ